MRILFFIGIIMIFYDMLGHLACGIARVSAKKDGSHFWANMWNKYSSKIWPSISNSIHYDFFWSAWFFIAILLIILGR